LPHSIILLVAEAAGVILLVGTMLLIGLRRVYIDSETKQPTEFEIPLVGKVKTQAPALVLVLAGVLLIGYAVHEDQGPIIQQGSLAGTIDLQGASATVLVLAVPAPYQNPRESSGPFSINVPLLPGNVDYQVKYEVDQHIFPVSSVFANGEIKADPFVYSQPAPAAAQPIKDISDDDLKKLHIN